MTNRPVCAAVLTLSVLTCVRTAAGSSIVVPNDNRQSAGHVEHGVLTIELTAEEGQWQPEGPASPQLSIAAFRAGGGPLSTPGPLIRVPEGTVIVARIHNALARALTLHGFAPHPSTADAAVIVDSGQTKEVRFDAGAAGTYHYWASITSAPITQRPAFESQLGGALVVDAPRMATADRIFVMTEWDDRQRRVDETTGRVRRVFAINGQSWPYTERLSQQIGDVVRWRWINLTLVGHPMHLHGFYFDVVSTGDGMRDTVLAPDKSRHEVTERMTPGATMQMVWVPERAGNWLLHCHIVAHISPGLRFWAAAGGDDHANHVVHDPSQAMAGLVLGINVSGNAPAKTSSTLPARALTIEMRRRPGFWNPEDAYAFALTRGSQDALAVQATVPGPTLILKRGEPVEITLKNDLPEVTAVHWHGMELESYYDGVPGFSGTSSSVTPAIAPGQMLIVRFTPPRSGTFIYHTHSHDDRQLASGLYGALIVVDPESAFDESVDHVAVLGMQGPKDTQQYERFPVVVNGSATSRLTFKAGTINRLRLINITTNFNGLDVSLVGPGGPVMWRPVAKDGATLSRPQPPQSGFRQTIGVGETYDFEIDVPAAGRLWLEVRRASGEWVQQVSISIQ